MPVRQWVHKEMMHRATLSRLQDTASARASARRAWALKQVSEGELLVSLDTMSEDGSTIAQGAG